MEREFDYDLFIIGGGSGGLATAKEAAALGLKTALADFVKPTPMGTKWGLGGTCVNVGCIPKKMMHIASLLGEFREDMKVSGWKVDTNAPHSWETMAAMVQGHTKQSNWSYVFSLNGREIKYYNRLARFVDDHTVSLTDSTGDVIKVTAKNFLIAVGGRPNYPDIPGAKEHCITSDDLFWLKKSPGKTLVVGASYVALECGGFLKGLGLDTTIMVRSILLRGYDQDMAGRIGDYMAKHGVKFIRGTTPDKFEKTAEGKVKVFFKVEGRELTEEYDTVLIAIGRHADTKGLELEKAGVKVAEETGKIIVGDDDKTNVAHIYTIGDCAAGRPEFTPTAIMAGKLLVRRLAGKGTRLMDYRYVPATVFTPIEYGCVGYTEAEAIKEFGEDGIVAYHSNFAPLEWAYVESREEDPCYGKIVVRKSDDRVIGFHYFGPHAGEITQGFAVAIKKGVTKEDFDYTVPIHPTVAEEMVLLKKTKAEDPVREKDCCS